MAIVWIDQSSPSDAQTGGKGASLVSLSGGGFPVPPGFIIAADSFRRFVSANGLQPLIDAVLETPDLRVPKVAREATADLTAAIAAAVIPDDVRDAVAAAYARLQPEAMAVAVRSSALSEDGASASSAGLYETYLNVRDLPAVLDAVHRCYQSLWSARAVQYRAFKGLGSREEAMAVVVMAQVTAEAAGVAFTANPITGDRNQIVVNASWGLGEAVVSGRVTPDSFIVDKRSLTIQSREIAGKEVEIVPDPTGGSGTVPRAVDGRRSMTPALTDEQLVTLATLCREIERRYDRPVDIEWATARRSIYILQARPITSLP
ncbi:MAG: PEP/pyruvate-binding domain-containing protein [Dehalococcoidia bacterium]